MSFVIPAWLKFIKLDEALDALERLKLYEGQREGGDKALIATLTKAERVI